MACMQHAQLFQILDTLDSRTGQTRDMQQKLATVSIQSDMLVEVRRICCKKRRESERD